MGKRIQFQSGSDTIIFQNNFDRNYNELEYRNVDALLSGNGGRILKHPKQKLLLRLAV
jgi:hypothetical protein